MATTPTPAPVAVTATVGSSRAKVPLKPGHTLVDWYRYKNSHTNLSGVSGFQLVTKAELKRHNTPEDCWIALFGKVYNITPYLDYHPGGIGKLLICKGRDATQLYVKTHAWVNHESLLDRCLVGMLVPGEGDEEPAAGTSAEQEPTNGEEQELTSEQEAEVTMFPARGGQQVSK